MGPRRAMANTKTVKTKEKERLTGRLEQLRGHVDDYKALWLITAKADGGAIFPVDLLSTAITHRAMCLVSGFCDLIEGKNFICAAPLVRLMLDNLLRFYAVWLVDDPHDFATEILRGRAVRRMKDRSGHKMTDNYLVHQLSKEYKWLANTYTETSGYIHLSSKHYFNTLKGFDAKTGAFRFSIAEKDTCIRPEFYHEAVDAMLEISTAIMRYLYSWAHTKETKALAAKHSQEHCAKQRSRSSE